MYGLTQKCILRIPIRKAMSQQGIVRCYTIIIEKVRTPLKCTFNDLLDALHQQGFEVSSRTLQRYIENIRNEFDINILYDRFNNRYTLDDKDTERADQFVSVMGMQHAGALLGNQLNSKTNKFIAPDINATYKGIEWMELLLRAMEKSKWITIQHRKFGSEQTKVYTLQPYLLKEYQYRWYLFSKLSDNGPFRTFGLDRIEHVAINKDSFKRSPHFDPQTYFKNIVGLVYDNEEEVQQVVLRVEQSQANYLKTSPIHHSQRIVKEDGESVDFCYQLIPNFELNQRILMYGESISVVKPKWLKNEIARIGKALYKNNS
jgi:predicted DNA-binding transcriptional regulator YafY